MSEGAEDANLGWVFYQAPCLISDVASWIFFLNECRLLCPFIVQFVEGLRLRMSDIDPAESFDGVSSYSGKNARGESRDDR